MAGKDYFSKQAIDYSKYRPTYPKELYQLLLDKVESRDIAWDCATGNGQVANRLAQDFNQVEATDISDRQLNQAATVANIHYRVSKAEETPFPSRFFDLITVGQALHWFDFDAFYREVKRVLKPNGVFAAWTYTLVTVNSEIDQLINRFYTSIVGPYWPEERKHIDLNYETIPFPFQYLAHHDFQLKLRWTAAHMLGYLSTWSSTQQYIQHHKSNPIALIEKELLQLWGEEEREVVFPVLLKVGRRLSLDLL